MPHRPQPTRPSIERETIRSRMNLLSGIDRSTLKPSSEGIIKTLLTWLACATKPSDNAKPIAKSCKSEGVAIITACEVELKRSAMGTSSGRCQVFFTPAICPVAETEHLASSSPFTGEVSRSDGGGSLPGVPPPALRATSPARGEDEERDLFTPQPRACFLPRVFPNPSAILMAGWKGALARRLLYIRGNLWPNLNIQW